MKLFNVNPREPVRSAFDLHLKIVKYCGLWPFVSEKRKKLYNFYTIFSFTFWLLLFVAAQAAYFTKVDGIQDFADSLYFFLIQGVTIPKNLYFYMNTRKIKACLERLESDLYLSKNSEEDKYVSAGIKKTIMFHRFGIFMCCLCICMWINSVFAPGSDKFTIVPALFPFEYKSGIGFYVVLLYQICGSVYSAITYLTADTFYTGFLFQATAQVQRLCSILAKVGNETTPQTKDGIIIVGPKENKEYHAQVIACIRHHQNILEFNHVIQSCFKQITFIQLSISLFTLCMTEFLLMMFLDDRVFFMNILPYFFTITFQMWQINHAGNELTFASKSLMSHAYFSNFVEMDVETRKVLITLMERFKMDIGTFAGLIFEIPINNDTFVRIMKTSYSYFAVLQSVQEN